MIYLRFPVINVKRENGNKISMGHEYKDALNRQRDANTAQAHHDEQKNKALRSRTGNPMDHHPLPDHKASKKHSLHELSHHPKKNWLVLGCLMIVIVIGIIIIFSP
jgi:hypothetical protein